MAKEEIIQNSIHKVESSIRTLESIWERLGMSARQVDNRRRDCFMHICELMDTMVNEEMLNEEKIHRNIETYSEKIKSHLKELGELTEEEKMSLGNQDESETEALVEKDLRLKTEFKRIEILRTNRISMMSNLVKKCHSLALELTESVPAAAVAYKSSCVPSLEAIGTLTSHAQEFEQEKRKRQKEYSEIRARVANGMTLLGESPDDTFVLNILMEPEEHFQVIKENMERLREVENTVQKAKTEREQEMNNLWDLISKLWSLMGTPADEQESMKSRVKGLTDKDAKALREELGNLKELRKRSLGPLIEKVQCNLTEVKRKARITTFKDKGSEEISEGRLDHLTKDLEKFEKIFQDRLPILQSLQEWEDKVNRLSELDAKAKDPARLKNRGGNLLNEERERKMLGRRIPKLTDAMMKGVAEWEEKYGEFLIDGITVADYRNDIMERCETKKEKEQIGRQLKRKMETEQEMRYGSKNPNKLDPNAAKRKKISKVNNPRMPDEVGSSSETGTTIYLTDVSSKSHLNVSDIKVAPWGSMRFSPNKPPSGTTGGASTSKGAPGLRRGSAAAKNITAVGAAIKKYASKLTKKENKPAKTTDNLEVPSTSGTFKDRRMRRRSKSESCIRQELLTQRTMGTLKPGISRLPRPSASNPMRLFDTPTIRVNSVQKVTKSKKILTEKNMESLLGSTVHDTSSILSETVTCQHVQLEQSVSAHNTILNEREFEKPLLDDHSNHKRSSMIGGRTLR